jgi:hypothetical protein
MKLNLTALKEYMQNKTMTSGSHAADLSSPVGNNPVRHGVVVTPQHRQLDKEAFSKLHDKMFHEVASIRPKLADESYARAYQQAVAGLLVAHTDEKWAAAATKVDKAYQDLLKESDPKTKEILEAAEKGESASPKRSPR